MRLLYKSRPCFRASAKLPHLAKLSKLTTSALMKPLSISEWIFPASFRAMVPLGIVQAFNSAESVVKNGISPRS